jgi:L-alanine-DL-glutamate epimerase-like enolase superfamily enzyme
MKQDEDISAMGGRLRRFHAANNAERLRDSLLRWLEDPLKPQTAAGRLRVNPILVLLVSLAVMAAGTFLFFGLVQP